MEQKITVKGLMESKPIWWDALFANDIAAAREAAGIRNDTKISDNDAIGLKLLYEFAESWEIKKATVDNWLLRRKKFKK